MQAADDRNVSVFRNSRRVYVSDTLTRSHFVRARRSVARLTRRLPQEGERREAKGGKLLGHAAVPTELDIEESTPPGNQET